MRKAFVALAFVGGFFVAVVTSPAMAQAVDDHAGGKLRFDGLITGFDGVDNLDAECTTSTDFEEMTGMSVEFRLRGRTSQKVIVMFTGIFGQGSGLSPGLAEIQLLIDGTQHFGDVEIHQGSTITTDGFNFISSPLAPGPHRAVIQWRRNPLFGDQVCVDDRSLIVQHR